MDLENLKCTDIQLEKIKYKINEINKLILEHQEKSFALCSSTLLYLIDNDMLEKNINLIYKNLNNINVLTYSSGLVGIGWFFQYLINKDLIDIEDVNELMFQIDEVAYKTALSDLKQNNHDFLHGSIGSAIYLTNRINENNKVREYISEILLNLKKLSKNDERGIYWEESTFYLKEHELDKEIINLSLAHGLASKIVLFSKLFQLNINLPISEELLRGSVKFMLNSKNSKNSISVFPTRIGENDSSDYSRLSWCYGDLGISIALWLAGEALQDESIKEDAITICLKTTTRKELKDTGINDAGFCHGTAGVAHIYNRMYNYTGELQFKKAADYWINETLQMAKFDDGLAGYKSFFTEKYGGWVKNYGLLDGITGIGLALTSYINEEEPTWDSCLLLS